MDPRIQVGDVIYLTSVDGASVISLNDPTRYQVNPEKNFLEEKLVAKLIKKKDIQNLPNQSLFKICTSKAKEGLELRYGQMVCFQLEGSTCFITQVQESENDIAFNKLAFKPYNEDPNKVPYPKEFCWKLKPKLKQRKQGGFVFQNDRVSIETFLDIGGFLKPMSSNKLASGLKEYEWKIKCFRDVGNFPDQPEKQAEEPIKAQDPITLRNFDSQNFIGAEGISSKTSFASFVEQSLNITCHSIQPLEQENQESKEFYFKTNGFYQQKINKEKYQETEKQPFNGLFRIELEDYLSSNPLQSQLKVRIRHVQFGRYLTVTTKEEYEE